MEDRFPSYYSDTLSSNSSVSSEASSRTYASITSTNFALYSIPSELKSTEDSGDFWNKFERFSTVKKPSVMKYLKEIFQRKLKQSKKMSEIKVKQAETSFIEVPDFPTCPVGLYCVIDEFLTEYDLRLLEEEERAEVVRKRSTSVS